VAVSAEAGIHRSHLLGLNNDAAFTPFQQIDQRLGPLSRVFRSETEQKIGLLYDRFTTTPQLDLVSDKPSSASPQLHMLCRYGLTDLRLTYCSLSLRQLIPQNYKYGFICILFTHAPSLSAIEA
jgi:hypothetical protein